MTKRVEAWLATVASVFTIVGFFISLYVLPQELKFLGYTVVTTFLVVLLLALGYYLGDRARTRRQRGSDQILLEFFESKRANDENAEIVRFGLAVSTALWLSHKYATRRTIGEYVEEAASDNENVGAMIRVLIDDIGWTNVELGLYEEAEIKLTRGVELASEHHDGYYLAKGYRHLFGLNYRRGNLEAADEFLGKAVEATDKLPAGHKKDELTAEVHFAKSSLEYKKGHLDRSLAEIEIAHEMYRQLPDKEWIIKILARKGEILLAQRRIEEATEVFRKGLHDSRHEHFNRQTVKNLIGLGRCCYERKELARAQKHFTEALKIAETVGMFYEKTLIDLELEKFKNSH